MTALPLGVFLVLPISPAGPSYNLLIGFSFLGQFQTLLQSVIVTPARKTTDVILAVDERFSVFSRLHRFRIQPEPPAELNPSILRYVNVIDVHGYMLCFWSQVESSIG